MEVTTAGHQAGIAPQGAYYFAKDGLGSIVDIHNSTGAVVQHYVYSSFGKILKITNGGVDNTSDPLIKNRFTYTNREFDDESGLYYYRARYYDAHSGRFMQEDPHPGKMTNPITINSKYGYCGNNPINSIDPDGKFFFLAAALLSGGALGLGTFGVTTTVILSAFATTALGAGLLEINAAQNGELGKLYNSSKFWEGVGVSFGANLLSFGALRWMGLIGKTANTGAYVVEAKNWQQAAKVGAYFGSMSGLLQGSYYASTGAINYEDVGKFVLASAGAGALTFGIGKAFWPHASIVPNLSVGAGEAAAYIYMIPEE